MIEPSQQRIDPDPFTIASAFFAAGSFILQLVQVRQAAQVNSTRTDSNNREVMLTALEKELESFNGTGERLLKAVDRAAADVERELYDLPYRVGNILLLEASRHQQVSTELANLYGVLSNVSRWINHIIGQDATLANKLGEYLERDIGDFASVLNKIMAEGLPNRRAIQEGKAALRSLQSAIENELGNRN